MGLSSSGEYMESPVTIVKTTERPGRESRPFRAIRCATTPNALRAVAVISGDSGVALPSRPDQTPISSCTSGAKLQLLTWSTSRTVSWRKDELSPAAKAITPSTEDSYQFPVVLRSPSPLPRSMGCHPTSSLCDTLAFATTADRWVLTSTCDSLNDGCSEANVPYRKTSLY